MNKIILVPIIALCILFAQKVIGFEFTSEEMQIVNDGILSLAVLLGILSDPKKKK